MTAWLTAPVQGWDHGDVVTLIFCVAVVGLVVGGLIQKYIRF